MEGRQRVTRPPRSGPRRRDRVYEFLRVTRTDLALRREADMMAFYLGLTLLVALNVTRDEAPPPLPDLLLVVWGTTVGLALAHWFALTLAALLVRDPTMHHTPGEMLSSQLVMAVALGLVASAALLLSPARVEVVAARIAVALFIAGLVTSEARSSGSALPRALAVGAAALGVAMIIATFKLALK
jgi:hypothetical protein